MNNEIDFLRASDGTGEAVRAIVQATRSIASTTLEVDSVNNWPTKFVATVGTLSATPGVVDPTTVTIFKGHLSGGDIIIDEFAPGYSDVGNSVGQIVVLKPNTFWADTIADVLDVAHNNDGTLKDDAVTTDVITDANVTTAKLADASVTGEKLGTPVAFKARMSTDQSITSATVTQITLDTEVYDYGSNFASNTFTAPHTGIYNFTVKAGIRDVTVVRLIVFLHVNGSERERGNDLGGSSNRLATSTFDVVLTAGDLVTAHVFAQYSTGTGKIDSSSSYTGFAGHLIGKTA